MNAPAHPPRALVYERIDPTGESLAWLEDRGVRLTLGHAMWQRPFRRFSEDELIAAARGHAALMGSSGTRITRRVIESLPELRCISKFGIGFDSIDVAAASERGILVSNTPDETDAAAVCEHAIAAMLALKKRLLDWTPEFLRQGGWRGDAFAALLRGATVGIVGMGNIGRGVARRLVGWDVRLLAYSPRATDAPGGVTLIDLPTLLAQSDIVTLHAKPRPENRHLIDADALARMKPGAILINTSRAWLVDYAALRQALRSGHLGGAALDVFEQEPPDPADPLFGMPNVVVTPHTAAWTFEGLRNIGWHGARNLWAMLAGEGHADLVNPEARPRAAAGR